MGKHLTSLLAVLALAVFPSIASATQVSRSEPAARIAAAYPIPPTSTPGPAAGGDGVHAGASSAATLLAKLSAAALAGGSGLKLGASVSGPGTFTFVLSAKIHGKKVVLGSASKRTDAAGAITIRLTLSKAGKHALRKAKGKKLRVTVTATFTPEGGKAEAASSTATLR